MESYVHTIACGEIMGVCSLSMNNWYLQTLAALLLLTALAIAAFLFPPLVLLFIISITLVILIQTATERAVPAAAVVCRRCNSPSLRSPPRE